MQKQTVIFIGLQGSGKGTQVANLVSLLKESDSESDVLDLQTGRGFRALKDSDTYTARRVTEMIENGQLIPNALTYAIVVNELSEKLEENTHLTLDGFPRNVAQAEFFDELLAFYNRSSLSVVYLDTPEEVVRERMMSRGRVDDTEESINERLRLYREQTEPIISYYKNRPDTNFIRIDGSGDIDTVFTEIKKGLGI